MRKPDLSKLHFSSGPGLPTMIVPPGTQIQVDPQGQVSIRTPGNLVLQNSGAYATLSRCRLYPHRARGARRGGDGALRRDLPGAGLAHRLAGGGAHPPRRQRRRGARGDAETEKLEVGRNGRLVGNFRSEKELFALFSRFAGNVRALPPLTGEAPAAPLTVDAEVQPFVLDEDLDDDDDAPTGAAAADGEGAAAGGARGAPPAELPDALSLALLLLEQPSASGGAGAAAPAAARGRHCAAAARGATSTPSATPTRRCSRGSPAAASRCAGRARRWAASSRPRSSAAARGPVGAMSSRRAARRG